MQKSTYLLLVILLIIAIPVLTAFPVAAFNPKPVDYMNVEIIESGRLIPNGVLTEISLTTYLPMNYYDLQVTAESYEIITDSLGNEQIILKWTNTNDIINYEIKTSVESSANHVTNSDLKAETEASSIYLKKGDGVEFTEFIKETSFPYKNTLEKIAELTEFTHNYIEYDKTYVGKILNTTDILEQRKGVCVEYSTLLTSLLRTSGIPTRYVSGYAYSDVDKTFIGHSWIEVLMEDSSWLPVDPTWMEMGYLDAAHIKTANLLENKQTETLRYKGQAKNMNINWTKNEPEFNIIEKQDKPVHGLDADTLQKTFTPQETGYILGTVSAQECSLVSLRASSCVSKSRKPMLNILNPSQVIWLCGGEKEVYWFFNSTGNDYICPITIFDQENSVSDIEITITGSKDPGHATIHGPSTVGINEEFTLEAGIQSGFFFYSTKFGKHPYNSLTMNIDKPGKYPFYLYSDGMLETKTITVVENKEFDIIIISPNNATVLEEFPITLQITNLAHELPQAKISIELEDRQLKDIINLEKGKTINIIYNITATEIGMTKISASVYDKTISSYTTDINILEENKSFIDSFVKFFADIFDAVGVFFGSLF
ncbi:hypothetical protein CL614_01260 [archaeon]|nr:hypothetical protein [archaeon]|tara:strand:- start:1423 stop:3216 length:1794 start_codon:yes stop_codon:yes gene_type:complete